MGSAGSAAAIGLSDPGHRQKARQGHLFATMCKHFEPRMTKSMHFLTEFFNKGNYYKGLAVVQWALVLLRGFK